MASSVYLNREIEASKKGDHIKTLMVRPCHKDINSLANFGKAKALYLNLIVQDKCLYENIGKHFNKTPSLKYLITMVDRANGMDPVSCHYHVKHKPIQKFEKETLSGGGQGNEFVKIYIYDRNKDGEPFILEDNKHDTMNCKDETFIEDLMEELQLDRNGRKTRKTTLAKQGKQFLKEVEEYTDSQSPKRQRVATSFLEPNTNKSKEVGDLGESFSDESEASESNDSEIKASDLDDSEGSALVEDDNNGSDSVVSE